jgi:hypothetical protein
MFDSTKLVKEMLLSGDHDERAPYLRKISSDNYHNKLCKCCEWCPRQDGNPMWMRKCAGIENNMYNPEHYKNCTSYSIQTFRYRLMFLKGFIIRCIGGFLGCVIISMIQKNLSTEMVIKYAVITFVIQLIWVLVLIKAKKWAP